MDDTKVWYTSTTIWASIVAVIAGIANAFGFNLDSSGQQIIASSIVGAVSIVLGLISLWGRIQADTKITLTKK